MHRDVKPENILITDNLYEDKQVIKLCDFGCSKIFAATYSSSSVYKKQISTIAGTIDFHNQRCWMAPEVTPFLQR